MADRRCDPERGTQNDLKRAFRTIQKEPQQFKVDVLSLRLRKLQLASWKFNPGRLGNSMSDRKNFSISELAKEFDVTTRSIRFYEHEGLLHPSRLGQTRSFSSKDRARLKLILRGKRMGFSLAETRELFDLWDETLTGSEKQLLKTLEVVKQRREQLAQQKKDIAMMERELDDHETRCSEALEDIRQRKQRTA